MNPALALHAAVTLFLCGLIWTVQTVHYPLFARVGGEGFGRYEREHQRRIGRVVAPAMLLELALATWLVARPPAGLPESLAWAGLALLGVVWFTTAAVSVPAHRVLSTGFDERAHRRLVRSNWPRTVAWTARGALAFWMLSL